MDFLKKNCSCFITENENVPGHRVRIVNINFDEHSSASLSVNFPNTSRIAIALHNLFKGETLLFGLRYDDGKKMFVLADCTVCDVNEREFCYTDSSNNEYFKDIVRQTFQVVGVKFFTYQVLEFLSTLDMGMASALKTAFSDRHEENFEEFLAINFATPNGFNLRLFHHANSI